MKTSATIRIIIYSLLFIVLLSLLVGGILAGKWISELSFWVPSGKTKVTERSVNAEICSNLDIEWAAGSIKIMVGGSDKITVKESKDSNNPYTISTDCDDDTLSIQYFDSFSLNFGNLSSKDLTIIVPQNWNCEELTINGAALDIDISGLNVESLELDGAATELTFSGSLGKLDCDGAAAEINLKCTNAPDRITIDGAACELDLTLPANSGFLVDAEGLAIDFRSDCAYATYNGKYSYGNERCKIQVSGLGCKVSVDEVE